MKKQVTNMKIPKLLQSAERGWKATQIAAAVVIATIFFFIILIILNT